MDVVYGFDPLCGWCYGFAPAFAMARAELAGAVEFGVASGGLVTGERRRPVGLDAGYLRAGLAAVAAATGVSPGPAFADLLDRGTYVSDSEPVCRAMWAARELAGDGAAIELGAALSRAYYGEGREPDDPDLVAELGAGLGLPDLVDRWATEAARRGTAQWWARSRAVGLTTYPSLLAVDGGRWRPLLVGVAPADRVVDLLRTAAATAAAT